MVDGEFTVETCQRRREIESESVDANAFGPIAQRIHGECGDVRVGEIKRVAAAGGVVQAADLDLWCVDNMPDCRVRASIRSGLRTDSQVWL